MSEIECITLFSTFELNKHGLKKPKYKIFATDDETHAPDHDQ